MKKATPALLRFAKRHSKRTRREANKSKPNSCSHSRACAVLAESCGKSALQRRIAYAFKQDCGGDAGGNRQPLDRGTGSQRLRHIENRKVDDVERIAERSGPGEIAGRP